MQMTEKVKLPKEVAEAIESIRIQFAEHAVHDMKWLEGEIDDTETVRAHKDTILNFIAKKGFPGQFSPNHPLIIYHKALVNGYEIELTPKERAIQYLIKHGHVTSGHSEHDVVSAIMNILGVKEHG